MQHASLTHGGQGTTRDNLFFLGHLRRTSDMRHHVAMTQATYATRVPTFTLGWRMRIALESAGITAGDMAIELGYNRTTLTRWMHDQGPTPRPSLMKQWALATGVSYEWLRYGLAPASPDDSPREITVG